MSENVPDADQKLTHCLNLLKSGKPIFPVGQNKTPLITTWKPYQDRLPTEQEATQWWTRWPDANIGMATGRLSGVVVIDCDYRDAAERFLEEYPEAEKTQIATSGRGLHFYFRYEEGIRNGNGTLGPRIDIRGQGGYVVVPPSIHANGKSYRYFNENQPLALPENLKDILLNHSGGNGSKREQTIPPEGRIPEGQRNNTLTSLAGTMRRRGMTQEAIEAALLAENSLRCDPPLEGAEVTRIAESVAKYPPGEQNQDGSQKAEGNQDDQTVDQSQQDGKDPTPSDPILKPAALHGLPGRIVNSIDPYTEADRVAVLVTNLVYFGNVIGRGPHFMVEATPHYANLYSVFQGRTSKSRKGMSRSTTDHIYPQIDSQWVTDCFDTGLSSGEGLIHRVRDPQPLNSDPGISDKRLMVIEEEFSRPLKVMARDTNILSDVLRNAWDGKPLRNMTRNSPEKATDAHVSIIGHITEDELLKYLTQTDMANGFANRFLWFYVKRSKLLPNPQGIPSQIHTQLVTSLTTAVNFARSVGRMHRDQDAESLWVQVYSQLSEGKPGLVGAITSRAEAQVLRLSMIYALMDCSAVIQLPHLEAALALWEYCEQSVELIFEDQTGDRNVDSVAKLLKVFGKMSRTQIFILLGRNADKKEIDRIIRVLCSTGRAELKAENGLESLYPKN